MSDPLFDDVTDPLAVGLTRPAMKWGVTYSALIVNAMLTMECFLLTRSVPLLLVAAPIHGISMGVCAREPRWFELTSHWLKFRAPALARNARYWRASSYSPLMLDLPRARHFRRARALMAGPRP